MSTQATMTPPNTSAYQTAQPPINPQIELHRHLDVSLRPATLLRLLQERQLEPQSTSLEQFQKTLILREPLADLATVLNKFTLLQKVFDSPAVLKQIAFEVVEDCWREGSRRVELRFSPSFMCEHSGIPWKEALESIEAGIKDAVKMYPDIQVGLIGIVSRDYGIDKAWETVDFVLAHRNSFIGLDLAGNEVDYPCTLFAQAFAKARNAGMPITVHAGEATGPDHIWAAIEELGAQRIGHGVSSIRDPQLMEKLRRSDICLEICPTSNWITRAVPSFEAHPLPQLLRAGVPVSINTDDPSFFGVGLPDEIRHCRERLGLSDTEIQHCFITANRCSFLSKK